MREWINIVEGQRELDEAPVSDFGVFGDKDVSGSFRDSDLKAMHNPKWQKKVERFFRKCPVDVNLYFLNAENAEISSDFYDGKYYVNHLHNGMTWVGVRDISRIADLLGYAPINYQKSITVLYVENEGDNRIALTPWIVAHRMSHAISASVNRLGGAEIRDEIEQSDNVVEKFFKIFSDEIDIHYDLRSRIKTLLPLFKFKSASQSNFRPGEVYHELFAQYILNGKITFNQVDVSTLHKFSSPEMAENVQEYFNTKLPIWETRLTTAYAELLDACVGKAFIL
jgi:hypothetical protein